MISRGSKRYWRKMFEGEDGDYVKNLLTDGQWKPETVGGVNYNARAVKIGVTIFAVIIAGVVGFGVWKFLVWVW